MNDRENAYFTVEAAMVFPIVLGIILVLLYLAFFQYNRCLLEQDIGALAMKGCSLGEEEKGVLMQELKGYAAEINQDKYIGWNWGAVDIKLAGDEVTVSGKGELRFPFTGLFNGGAGSEWMAETEYTNQRTDPVNCLRLYRKAKGGK